MTPGDLPQSERITSLLRADIISGRLPQGERLVEDRLAERYGVSRVPVREAIRRLQSEGFVHTRPNRGATVATIETGFARDLLEVRASMETLAIALVVERAADTEIADLRAIVERGKAAVAAADWDAVTTLNGRFHLGLAAASHNTIVMSIVHQLGDKMTWVYASSVIARAGRSWDEHEEILEAVERRDVPAARQRTLQHIRNAAGAIGAPPPEIDSSSPGVTTPSAAPRLDG